MLLLESATVVETVILAVVVVVLVDVSVVAACVFRHRCSERRRSSES